jgi:hypothetical protein
VGIIIPRFPSSQREVEMGNHPGIPGVQEIWIFPKRAFVAERGPRMIDMTA